MHNDYRTRILQAFSHLFRPLTRMLLRNQIGCREAIELVKAAYVDVAADELSLNDRPASVSRISSVTGLTRKDVRRLKDKLDNDDASTYSNTTPLMNIVYRWHAEEQFMDRSGQPKSLEFDGEEGSFVSLVRQIDADMVASDVKRALIAAGSIVEDDDGRLTLVKRSFRPQSDQETLINCLVHHLYPCTSTVAHNTNPGRDDDTWAQKVAYSRRIAKGDLAKIRRIGFDRVTDLAVSVDDLFIATESSDRSESLDSDTATVVVGAFYFEESNKSLGDKW